MPVTVVLDLQHGDSGKGRVSDSKGEKFDLFARVNGANNAGHRVDVNGEIYNLHFIPSGVVRDKKVVIGNGCVVNPDALLQEIRGLKERGLKVDLVVDERAHIITQQHIDLDRQKGRKIGTTGKGVGPAYTAKVAREGIRAYEWAKEHPESEFGKFVGNASLLVRRYLDRGKNVLLEGAQGFGLDIDHGTYPFCTSSMTTLAGALQGIGISHKAIEEVIGVFKPGYTRVGEGPFPTEFGGKKSAEHCAREGVRKKYEIEMFGVPFKEVGGKIFYNNDDPRIIDLMNSDDDFEKGIGLRLHADEYGTTTNRPRRCGRFDSVIVREGIEKNGVDKVAINKLDVMTGFKRLEICDCYRRNEHLIRDWPVDLESCEPMYLTLSGWGEDIRSARYRNQLPHNAITYVETLLDTIGNPDVLMIGVGPERDQIVQWH